MKRRLLVLGLAVVMVLTTATGAFASSNITSKQALAKALKSANVTKSEVYDIECEYDDGAYEVEFTKRSNRAEYSFEYSRKGTLREKSVDYNRAPVYGKSLTKSDARAKVVKFGGFKKSTVANGTTWLERDDGMYVYHVDFSTKNYWYEYEVNAKSGKILEYEKVRF